MVRAQGRTPPDDERRHRPSDHDQHAPAPTRPPPTNHTTDSPSQDHPIAGFTRTLVAPHNGLHVQWLLDPERAHHNDPEPADLDIRAGLADVLARGGQQDPLAVDVAAEVILDGLDGDTRSSLSRAELVSSGGSAPATGTIIKLKLTPQELRVALAIQRGLTNTDVAAELFLSVKTVEFHLSSIYRKLGISSRAQLIRVLNEGRTT